MGTPVKRYTDWPQRLEGALQAAEEQAFDWGSWHCGHFLASCINAMTGVNPLEIFCPKAKTEKGVYGAVRRFGGGGVGEAAEKLGEALGALEIAPPFARRGDPVVIESGEVEVFGIMDLTGRRAVLLHPEKGLVYAPARFVKRAWRLG